MTSVVIELL